MRRDCAETSVGGACMLVALPMLCALATSVAMKPGTLAPSATTIADIVSVIFATIAPTLAYRAVAVNVPQ